MKLSSVFFAKIFLLGLALLCVSAEQAETSSESDNKGDSQQQNEEYTTKNHRHLYEYNDDRYITALGFSESATCDWGLYRATAGDGLNGDLNQGAGSGSKDIYTCISKNPIFGPPITHIRIQKGATCASGYRRAGQALTLNGDLNQGAGSGSKDIFVCYTKRTEDGDPITNIEISKTHPATSQRAEYLDGLNGDLNQDAGSASAYVFFKIFR
ncbi:expressed unknown protein [Seminavis robusta]|uniref:Uncharacterized protein n=1 Tax=Seminavis robusta TaxID=568900 RepID=A0A9N8EDZ9_9STRA|nr:expressed unknown protein [Seminavis robusta]|eukprot:Sro938_g222360.1 n/a (212) ;mRNA; r:34240-35024